MALACACGNSATWTSLHAEDRHVSARCSECGAMVNAVDLNRIVEDAELEADEPESPYQQIAALLRERINTGDLVPGDTLPTVKQLAAEHGVSYGTAQRAIALLAEECRVVVSRGVRAIVTSLQDPGSQAAARAG